MVVRGEREEGGVNQGESGFRSVKQITSPRAECIVDDGDDIIKGASTVSESRNGRILLETVAPKWDINRKWAI